MDKDCQPGKFWVFHMDCPRKASYGISNAGNVSSLEEECQGESMRTEVDRGKGIYSKKLASGRKSCGIRR